MPLQAASVPRGREVFQNKQKYSARGVNGGYSAVAYINGFSAQIRHENTGSIQIKLLITPTHKQLTFRLFRTMPRVADFTELLPFSTETKD
jgi:hypothetical protein